MAFTFFFRDLQVLELSIEHVLPYITGRSKVRIWNAGCATGMETYSLAILFAENMGTFAFKNLKIQATDIDESGQFGQIIKEGIYKEESLKRIPKDLLKKYFSSINNNGLYKIDENIKQRVSYQKHDLTSLDKIGTGFSLVVCKNVLLHINQQQRINVIKMFHESLAPGGFLVMEQTQKLPDELSHLFERVVMNGQLYKKI